MTSPEEANAQLKAYKDAVHRIEADSETLGARALQRLSSTT
ncbi:MAG TPA: hypothetical protein VML58_10595 [Burkholderiaceae bacterium]|nr:hypothetical protein [Burkholderiaceae bacterium]